MNKREILDTPDGSDATAAARLGAALAEPAMATMPANGHSTPYVIVPDGFKVQNLESMFRHPARSRGTTELMTINSFNRFVNEMAGPHTRLYGVPPKMDGNLVTPPAFVAVFNDAVTLRAEDAAGPFPHEELPGWGDHVARYIPALSPEWIRWAKSNAVQMDQGAFAQFIEDNLPDVTDPPGADMLDLSRTLEAKKAVNFASSTRLSDGSTQFKFEETIEGSSRGGQLKIPDAFKIAIPVLLGGERYPFDVRFRYRIDNGKLRMWYELARPHKVIEHLFADLALKIREDTGIESFVGMPPIYNKPAGV